MSGFIISGYNFNIIIYADYIFFKLHLKGKLKELLDILAMKSENKGVTITLKLRDWLHSDSGLWRDTGL